MLVMLEHFYAVTVLNFAMLQLGSFDAFYLVINVTVLYYKKHLFGASLLWICYNRGNKAIFCTQ